MVEAQPSDKMFDNAITIINIKLIRQVASYGCCSVDKHWGASLQPINPIALLEDLGVDISYLSAFQRKQLLDLPSSTEREIEGLREESTDLECGIDELEHPESLPQILTRQAWWIEEKAEGGEGEMELLTGVTELWLRIPGTQEVEIAPSTFRWNDGQIAFVAGALSYTNQDEQIYETLEKTQSFYDLSSLLFVLNAGYDFPIMRLTSDNLSAEEEELTLFNSLSARRTPESIEVSVKPLNNILAIDRKELIEAYNDLVSRLYQMLADNYAAVKMDCHGYENHYYNINGSYLLALRFSSEAELEPRGRNYNELDIFRKEQSEWVDSETGLLSAGKFGAYVRAHGVRRILYNDYESCYSGDVLSRVYSCFNPVNQIKVEFQVDTFSDRDALNWHNWNDDFDKAVGVKSEKANAFEFSWPVSEHPSFKDYWLPPYTVFAAPESAQRQFSYLFFGYDCDHMIGRYTGTTSPTLANIVSQLFFPNIKTVYISPVVPLPAQGQTEWINTHIRRIGGLDSVADPRYKELMELLLSESLELDPIIWGSFIMFDNGTHDIRDALVQGFSGGLPLSDKDERQIADELRIHNLRTVFMFHDLTTKEFMS